MPPFGTFQCLHFFHQSKPQLTRQSDLGNVGTFRDGTTIIGHATLNSSGNGTHTIPSLTIGVHNIPATSIRIC